MRVQCFSLLGSAFNVSGAQAEEQRKSVQGIVGAAADSIFRFPRAIY
jgi:hypothetical protein